MRTMKQDRQDISRASGRPPAREPEYWRSVDWASKSVAQIAKEEGVAPSTVYRAKSQFYNGYTKPPIAKPEKVVHEKPVRKTKKVAETRVILDLGEHTKRIERMAVELAMHRLLASGLLGDCGMTADELVELIEK